VSGPDYAQVRLIARRVASETGASPFTREVNLTAGEPERVITLNVNQTAARAAGVSSEDIAQTLNTVWSGRTVTTVRDNDRLVDVVLRASDKERLDISTLSSLVLTTATGKKIPLSEVATPVWGVDDPVIWRRQRLPFITVQTDLAPGLNAQTVSSALRAKIDQLRAQLPEGYHIEEGGR
jgi:multidrug efflux pump subunit AcrB